MAIQATDEDIVTTARKYGVQAGSLKCEVFRLLDAGLSRGEVRFMLRDRRRSDDAGTFAGTVRSYHAQWRERRSGPKG